MLSQFLTCKMLWCTREIKHDTQRVTGEHNSDTSANRANHWRHFPFPDAYVVLVLWSWNLTMKALIITAGSLLLTAGVLANAYAQKNQFYPSVVYITKSNPSMAVSKTSKRAWVMTWCYFSADPRQVKGPSHPSTTVVTLRRIMFAVSAREIVIKVGETASFLDPSWLIQCKPLSAVNRNCHRFSTKSWISFPFPQPCIC